MCNIRDKFYNLSFSRFDFSSCNPPSIGIKLNEERKVTRAVSNYTVDLFNATAILSCETFSALYVFHDALQ